MMDIKQGDTHVVKLYVVDVNGAPVDLTGASVKLWSRPQADATPTELACSVTNAAGGEVSHTLTGTLTPRRYYWEVQTTKGGVIATAPSGGYLTVHVVAQIG